MTNPDIVEKIIIPLVAALGGGIVGAFFAFRSQKNLIKHADKRYVLITLMGYRHDGTTEPDFVKALNMTVIVYHDNIRVKAALHLYLTYTGSPLYSVGQRVQSFVDLCTAMAHDIGYTDITHNDVDDFYVPERGQPQAPQKPIDNTKSP